MSLFATEEVSPFDADSSFLVPSSFVSVFPEAINTSAVLYHVTKKEAYAENYAEFMEYLDEKVLDHVHGSWFHQMNEKNEVIGTVWPGKSDLYHAFQATLIPYHTPELSIAPAVKEGKEI